MQHDPATPKAAAPLQAERQVEGPIRQTRDNEKYYALVFGSQQVPYLRPGLTHTWAVAVKATSNALVQAERKMEVGGRRAIEKFYFARETIRTDLK